MNNAKSNIHNDKVIIVYDGDCIFCSRSMAWIVAHDVHDRIRLAPCSSMLGARLMHEHGIDSSDPSTFLVLINGKPFIQSRAMLALVPMLDIKAQPLRIFGIIPNSLRNFVYDWTARNRHRLIKGQCPVPSAEMIRRIIA